MRIAALAVLGLAATVAPAATQPTPPPPAAPEVAIHVEWDPQDKPKRVQFDGSEPFTVNGSEHLGRQRHASRWVTSDLAVAYESGEFPLRIVTFTGQDPVRFRVVRARYQRCTKADTREILSATPATVNDRVALMMRARALLTSGLCPTEELWKPAKRYFDTNCALAGDPRTSIELAPDAQRLFRRHAKTDAHKKEAETCTALRQQRAIQSLRREAEDAQGDPDRAAAVNRELLALAEDPLWAGGFAALGLDPDHFRAAEYKALYAAQNSAFQRGDIALATSLNDQLTALIEAPENAAAFESIKVDLPLLKGDRGLFETRARQQGLRVEPAAPNPRW